jgi:hypothetical protein
MQTLRCEVAPVNRPENRRPAASSALSQSRRSDRGPAPFRSTPINGHRQTAPACRVGAIFGQRSSRISHPAFGVRISESSLTILRVSPGRDSAKEHHVGLVFPEITNVATSRPKRTSEKSAGMEKRNCRAIIPLIPTASAMAATIGRAVAAFLLKEEICQRRMACRKPATEATNQSPYRNRNNFDLFP